MKKVNTRSRGNSKATSRSAALEARARLEREQEEEILSLLRKEADAFVPNVYPSVKKKAGLLAPIETREELSLTEILGNEGNKMVPDLEKLIYQKTGARKSFRLGNHLNFRRAATAIGTCLSLVFVVAAVVTVTSALPAGSGAPGALIRLSIAPASSQNAERSVSEAPVNPYKPEFLLVPTSDAKIYQEGFSPMNLSATYVVDGLGSPDRDAFSVEEVFSALFDGSYEEFKEALFSLGETPLPKWVREKVEPEDAERYQTIFAAHEGAVAAPTAGMHFSKHLMKRMEIKGVDCAFITLHVGLGNFRTVDVEDLSKHKMDSEQFFVTEEAARAVNTAKGEGHKVVAIGTTVMRTLETAVSTNGMIKPMEGWTNKFIFAPYDFTVADAMVTNFHLPYSTQLMMVAAFGGYENVMNAYRVAKQEGYRFGTYGDAMLIL